MRATELIAILGLAIALLVNVAYGADKPFTGVFEGQGRGCLGKLYVKEKTIAWNTPYSVCGKTSYSVIEKDLNSKSQRIAFALDRKTKRCRYVIIELSFDPDYPDFWLATGYQSREDFDDRRTDNQEIKSRSLSCGVRLQ